MAHELAHEPAEQLWGEWAKAVAHDPAWFLRALGEMGVFPHLRGLEWLGQARGLATRNHEEDLFDHILMAVTQARRLLGPSLEGITAALFHDVGKALGLTPHNGKEAAEQVTAALEELRRARCATRHGWRIEGNTLEAAQGHRPGPGFGAALRGLRATRLAEVMR